MIIRGPRPESSFYTLDKRISEDLRLSWAARGLLIFLLGKPDGWEVSVQALVNETQNCIRGEGLEPGQPNPGHTKRDGVKAILAELIRAGYLKRGEKPRHNPDGTMAGYDYFVSEVPSKPAPLRDKGFRAASTSTSPSPDQPSTVQPSPVQPSPAHPQQVSTEFEVKTEVKQNTVNPSSPAAPAKAAAGDAEEPKGKTYPDEFLLFWQAYPRKQGKLAAFKRWEHALKIIGGKRADAVATLLAGAMRYAKATALLEPGKVKMAEGWLNDGRWEDEETPEAGVQVAWWTSAPGIEGKGKELGMHRKPDEAPAAFKLRVLVAAGDGPWQEAEVAKAERDNAHGYAAHLRKLFGWADPAAIVPPAAPTPEAAPVAAPAAKSTPPAAFKQAMDQLKKQQAGK